MKGCTFIAAFLAAFGVQSTEYINYGMVKGSISDVTGISVKTSTFNWINLAIPNSSDAMTEVVNSLNGYINSNVKNSCKEKFDGKYNNIYFGIDNLDFTRKHRETNREIGQSITASFQFYCAIRN